MSQQEFEHIEKYLKGEMESIEKIDFEKSMMLNPDLKQSVDDLRIEIEAIEEVTFRDRLDKMHNNISNTENNPSIEANETPVVQFNWKKLMAAASILLLFGIGYFMLQKPQHERLYAAYFKPDPGLVTPMSATENYEFFRGMVDYKQGDYKLAAKRWEELLKTKPTNDTLLFYLGVSNMAMENNEFALLYLKQMPEDGSSAFTSESYYYLGLSELKEGNIQLAKKYLTKSLSPKAEEVLKKLN